MKTVDDYESIRKAFYVEGLSIREISKRLHHGRNLVRKAIDHAQPESYRLEKQRPGRVLAPYKPKIDALIAESEQLPRKQRYTGHKIYQLIQVDGYQGCEGNVHHYVSQQKKALKHRQAFLPLEFEPGQDAQVDWGEVQMRLGEFRQVAIEDHSQAFDFLGFGCAIDHQVHPQKGNRFATLSENIVINVTGDVTLDHDIIAARHRLLLILFGFVDDFHNGQHGRGFFRFGNLEAFGLVVRDVNQDNRDFAIDDG